MKNIALLLSFFCALFLSAQDINKIFPPDGFGLSAQEMRPHYFDSGSNTLFCSTKIYNDTESRYENHIVLYNTIDESVELIDSFFATSNVDWINFSGFKKHNDSLFFIFGKKIWRYNFNTQVFDLLLNVINLDGFDIVGDLLIYYTPGVVHFMDLITEQVVTTYNAAYIDAFHIENDNIYFYKADFGFSSAKIYQLVKYNITNNSFNTLFSNSFNSNFSLVRKSNVVKLGDNLIYTIQTASNTASYVSLNITNNTVNTSFTFNISTQFQITEPFVINNQVYITTVNDTFSSNGINQPELTTIGKFIGSSLITSNSLYNNEIYRVVNTDDYGIEIWKTDGQTRSLLKDIILGTDGGMSTFSIGYIHNNKIYFANAQDVVYESDGTETGTVPLYGSDLFTYLTTLFHDNTGGIYFFGESPSLGSGMFKLIPNSLSIDEFNTTSIDFYPNPASSVIYFSNTIDSVKIYDMQGKLVLTATNTSQLDINGLQNNSLYVIIYTLANKTYYNKLITDY